MLMKNKFLSKSVPRGTRTIWRYLGALFLLFTFAIGQMWAADPTVNAELSGSTKSDYFKLYEGTGVTLSADQSMSSGAVQVGSAFDASASTLAYYYGISSADDAIDSIAILFSGNGSNKSLNPALLGYSKATGYTASSPDTVIYAPAQTSTANSKAAAKWFKFDLSASNIKGVLIVKQFKKVTYDKGGVKCESKNSYPSSTQTLKCYHIKVWTHSSKTYTVTLNPNEGGYASAPTGWTASAGNYTKTVSAGALAIPEPSRGNYDFNGWKSGTTSVALTDGKLTVSKDTTLTAQWVPEKQTPTVTFNDGAFVVGEGAIALSPLFTSDNTSAVTFALKEATEDATVAGNNFTATKEGSYVIVATQPADATYKAVSAEATIVVTYPATGEATIIYNVAVGTGNTALGTASKDDNSASISNLSNFTAAGGLTVSALGAGKAGLSTKLQTLSSQDYAKYIYVTFDVADGKVFVLDSISTEIVAVTSPKTIKIVVTDTEDTKDSLDYNQTNNSNAAHHQFNFTSSAKAYAGTVTVKIYAYGATDHYRLAQPLKVCGTVQAAATKYNVTFDKNDEGASGSQTTLKYAAGAEVTLPGCTFTAPDNKEFDKWISSDVEISSNQFTMPNKDVTIKATWKALVAKYTVIFKDGDTELGTKLFDVSTNPSDADIEKTKPLYTFAAWQKDAADIALDAAFWATVAKDAEVTLTARYEGKYASSINVEQWVLDNGAGKGATTKTSALLAEMGTKNYLSNIAWENKNNELDTLDDSKTNRNYAYLGLKVKKDASNVRLLLQDGKSLKVKFGNVAATPNIKIGDAAATPMTITDGVYSLDAASGDREITISTTSAGAVVFKQIMINEDLQTVTLPWRVTYNANGGTCATAEAIWSGAALILPDVTPADADHTFAGWYDEVSGGELQGVAGASYTPTDNETLFAHFAPVEYAVNYAAGDHGSGDMVAANVGWGTVYTAVANGFTPETGYIFAGWAVTGVDGVSTLADGGSFTMPKNNVTLTAQWEDNSKVAMIVETSAKYESLAEAIAAATDGQTVQLLQNIHQEDGVLINKSLTLDLNGKTFTVDNGNSYVNRAIKVDAGTGTVLIKDGTVDALSTEDHNGGCYGGLRIETGNVTCTNVTFKNYRIYGMGVKPAGGTLVMNECTVISEIGGGMEVAGGSVVLNNCTFTQTGFDTAHAWISSCLGIGHNANLTVNGGTYTSEHYSLYVFTSGGEIDVESGSFTGDIVNQVTLSSYPDAVGAINISGGSFEGVGGNPIHFTTDNTGKTTIAISGGTFDAPVENQYCAPGYVPSAEVSPGVYTVVPKDGVEIIGVVVTGNTTGTVSGLYKGDASVNLNDKKIDSGKYIYVTLKEGYTFEENDVLIVDVKTKASIGTKALEITTGVGNIDGDVWKTIAFDDYATGDNIISLEGIAANQTSIGLKRSDNQNSYINGIRVLRPMKPMLTAITIDGSDGVINEAAKTVAVQIPYEADLAALTVVPTIVWNEAAASNSIVVNDGSAWTLGENTYKLTDKDGDYTVYTITLTRDVLKHTVSFNTHGGSAVASEEVVHGEYLAAAPADPTKDENVFKHWAETEDGEAVDVTSFAITADKEFHAVWEAEPAGIKLITDLGLNTTDFVSPALAEDSIVVNTVKYPYLVQFGSNKSSFSSITKADMVQYNATTNATKMKVTLYNSSTSEKKAYLYMWEEGAAGDDVVKEEITLPGKQITTSEYYEFNSNKNRSFYVCMDDRSNTRVLQVKVIESGDAIHQFGQMGYSLNFNKGRLYAKDGVATSFEGFNFTVASEYKVNNQTTFQSKAVNSFSITSPVIMHVERSSGKYYVYQDPANKGTLYDATADIELNATGTWYICSETSSSSVSLTGISFTAPKCAEPAFNALANSDVCAGDGYVALDGTATVADAGVPTYQWYREDDSAIDGETNATYTPTADGKYYVIAVNHLAGYADNEKKSALVTVTTHAGTAISEELANQRGNVDDVVTLEVVASGKNLHYAWKESATIDGSYTDVAGAADAASLNVTITEGMSKYYKVVVSGDCGDAQESIAKVEQFIPVAQADVTGSIAWNWANAASVAEIKLTASTAPKKNEGFVMANGAATVYNNANFESDKLYLEGEYIVRDGKYFQGQTIKFNTTVAGVVRVKFSHTGNNKPARELYINGVGTGDSRTNATAAWSRYVDVPAGEVTITAYHVDPADGAGQQYIRVPEIEFLTIAHRRTTGYNVGDLGTVCLEDATIIDGATLYELQGLDEHGYLAFDEIESGELEAGKPYLFEVTNPSQISFYKPVGAAHSDTEIETNGMIGTFSGTTLYQGADNLYYFSGRHIWKVNDFTVAIPIPAHRCYIDYDVLKNAQASPNPAPGRRRITMGVQGTQVATGCENLNVSDKPVKMLINGQLFILRGEKMYDAKGQLVK